MREQDSKGPPAVESVLAEAVRRTYTLLVRPILRRLPRRLRTILIRDLSASADPDETKLQAEGERYSMFPVLPSSPGEDLYLAYVKGLSVDRISRRQASGSRQ